MRDSDLDFFRYFPISRRDRQWGLYVSGVGSTRIPPHAPRFRKACVAHVNKVHSPLHRRGTFVSLDRTRLSDQANEQYCQRGSSPLHER